MHFNKLNLNPKLLRGIADRGYTDMTPVQEKTLDITLRGGDVAVQSQTGTGKTAAFLITLFERMLAVGSSAGEKSVDHRANPGTCGPDRG